MRNNDIIAVVGSPSTNFDLTLDIMETAIDMDVLGSLAMFKTRQSGADVVVIGQITNVEMNNAWHEKPSMRNLIKVRGKIDTITGCLDTMRVKFNPGGAFKYEQGVWHPAKLGVIPPTGTEVRLATNAVVENLLSQWKNNLFYLGKTLDGCIFLPMQFKTFSTPTGGEAYSIGIFGKTGSGKSSLAKMILSAYMKHKDMGVLLIDPAGEFSKSFIGKNTGSQGLLMSEVAKRLGRPTTVYDLTNIQLDKWELFFQLLEESAFLKRLKISKSEFQESAMAVIRDDLEKNCELDALDNPSVMEKTMRHLVENIKMIYKSKGAQESTLDVINGQLGSKAKMESIYEGCWHPVATLFSKGANKRKLGVVINDIMNSKNAHAAVLDIEAGLDENFRSDKVKSKILYRILTRVTKEADKLYRDGKSANVLVILDEAHRFAPSHLHENDEDKGKVRSRLVQAVKETRKVGVGWMFISQTLGGISQEITGQLRLLFFGFGLTMGSEFDRLKEHALGDDAAVDMYRSFRDPMAFGDHQGREFPFMAVGPISPLSVTCKPVFFNAISDVADFFSKNNI
jgi:nucleoside-triphosphatase THEP1